MSGLPPFFQIAQVTTSLDRAMKELGEAIGISRWLEMRDHQATIGGGAARAHIHVALAWKGDLMIELIEPLGGNDAIYREPLTGAGYQIRQHHMGRLFDSAEEFEAAMVPLRAAGVKFPIEGNFEDANGKCLINYADLRKQLGYYIENLMFTPEGRAWLGTVPRN